MKQVSLNKVCKITNGYAFKSSEFLTNGTPLLRISNFDNGPISVDEKTVYVDSENLNLKSEFIVEKGDVLIALSGATTGKYGIYAYDFPSLLNQRVGLVKSGGSKDLDGKYFYFFLSVLQNVILRKAGGAAQPNISTKTIGELQIPLPPLDQQKKIVAILDAADVHKQKTKALIAKYDELTQSLFMEMFGDPVTNPNKWKEKSLLEISKSKDDIKCGPFGTQLSKSEYQESGVPIWGIPQINSNFKKNPTEYISEDKSSELQAYSILPNDIIMSRKGNVGTCSLFPSNLKGGILHSDAIRLRIDNSKMLPLVLVWQFKLSRILQTQVSNVSSGAIMAGINVTKLKNILIQIPPIDIQTQFAERVGIIEAQKSQAQQSLNKAEELFNSLLHKAFNGGLVK